MFARERLILPVPVTLIRFNAPLLGLNAPGFAILFPVLSRASSSELPNVGSGLTKVIHYLNRRARARSLSLAREQHAHPIPRLFGGRTFDFRDLLERC